MKKTLNTLLVAILLESPATLKAQEAVTDTIIKQAGENLYGAGTGPTTDGATGSLNESGNVVAGSGSLKSGAIWEKSFEHNWIVRHDGSYEYAMVTFTSTEDTLDNECMRFVLKDANGTEATSSLGKGGPPKKIILYTPGQFTVKVHNQPIISFPGDKKPNHGDFTFEYRIEFFVKLSADPPKNIDTIHFASVSQSPNAVVENSSPSSNLLPLAQISSSMYAAYQAAVQTGTGQQMINQLLAVADQADTSTAALLRIIAKELQAGKSPSQISNDLDNYYRQSQGQIQNMAGGGGAPYVNPTVTRPASPNHAAGSSAAITLPSKPLGNTAYTSEANTTTSSFRSTSTGDGCDGPNDPKWSSGNYGSKPTTASPPPTQPTPVGMPGH